MSLPAGTYYVGDLCYVLKDSWDAVCDMIISDHDCLDGEFKLPDGRLFAIYSTRWGDGVYDDQEGRQYCVDAGSIGCVRLEDCDVSREEIEEDRLGHIVTFDKRINTGSMHGQIIIDRLVIDTDPVYDQD